MPRPFELECFFDAADHAYSDGHGRRHRSVTQILQDADCFDFSMIDPEVLRLAAERGRRVHELTAVWDSWRVRDRADMEDLFSDAYVPFAWRGYLRAYESFLQDSGFRAIPIETERPRLVEIAGKVVGACPDRIGYFPASARSPVILDLKTGIDNLSHPLQLAFYSMSVERILSLAMQHLRVAVYLKDDGRYKMERFRNKLDYHAALDCLHGGGAYLAAWKEQWKVMA